MKYSSIELHGVRINYNKNTSKINNNNDTHEWTI